jgi:hypothetical protein
MDAADGCTVVVCDLHGTADLAVLDALARLQLVARRCGMRCDVHAAGDVAALLDLTGLADALRQPVREPEPREQRLGVEEVVEVDEPPT